MAHVNPLWGICMCVVSEKKLTKKRQDIFFSPLFFAGITHSFLCTKILFYYYSLLMKSPDTRLLLPLYMTLIFSRPSRKNIVSSYKSTLPIFHSRSDKAWKINSLRSQGKIGFPHKISWFYHIQFFPIFSYRMHISWLERLFFVHGTKFDLTLWKDFGRGKRLMQTLQIDIFCSITTSVSNM